MSQKAFDALRERMVAEQIARRGIDDAGVLGAMRTVPRHVFVPSEEQRFAYEDRALPIGEGQTISQPYMVAVMTAALELHAAARVLEIGTGSGYQAAVLAMLAVEVVSIERRPDLAARARDTLAGLGVGNVRVIVGDGTEGYAPAAPYDGIIVTAAAPQVPEGLTRQLADGGRLVIPVGSAFHQDLVVIRRVGTEFRHSQREGCVFVPLIGKHGWASDYR